MGLRIKDKENKKEINQAASQPVSSSYERAKHYEDESIELDAIERLKSNILMLDDLQKRLSFMNNEIQSIIGTSKK